MPYFRKKPVVIEAEQFNPPPEAWDGCIQGGGLQATVDTGLRFMDYPVYQDERGPFLSIITLEGRHRADPGDWIITGIANERYPCKDSIFKQTYEPVAGPSRAEAQRA